MRLTTRIVLLAGALVLLGALPSLAELDVESYVQLSIARLELIVETWRERDEGPTEEELEELYASYGTDREAYFCFGGEHRKAVATYLRKHDDLRDTIEALSAEMHRLIAERSEE